MLKLMFWVNSCHLYKERWTPPIGKTQLTLSLTFEVMRNGSVLIRMIVRCAFCAVSAGSKSSSAMLIGHLMALYGTFWQMV
jgi:hypothetical protein